MAVNFSTAENYFYTILNGSLSAASLETELGTQGNVDSFSTLIQNAARFKQLRTSATGYDVLRGSKTAADNSLFQFALFYDNQLEVVVSHSSKTSITRGGFLAMNSVSPTPMSDLVRGIVYIKEGGHNGWLFRTDMGTVGGFLVNDSLSNNNDGHGYAYNKHSGVAVGGQSSGGSRQSSTAEYEYALDGLETQHTNTISPSRFKPACGGTEKNVWAAGGNDGSPSSDIDRFDYTTFTSTDTGTSLTTAREGCSGKTNDSFLYVITGDNGGDLTSIEKVDYSDDSVSTAAGSLTTAKDFTAAGRNTETILISSGLNNAREVYTLDTSDDSVTLESEELVQELGALNGTEGW